MLEVSAISLQVISSSEAQKKRLSEIPRQGVFVRPGDTFVALVNGNPIIRVSIRSQTYVVQATNVDVIDVVVGHFKRRVKPPDRIVLCIQAATTTVGRRYVERAKRLGLRLVWAMNFAEDLLTREPLPLEKTLVMVTALAHGF